MWDGLVCLVLAEIDTILKRIQMLVFPASFDCITSLTNYAYSISGCSGLFEKANRTLKIRQRSTFSGKIVNRVFRLKILEIVTKLSWLVCCCFSTRVGNRCFFSESVQCFGSVWV